MTQKSSEKLKCHSVLGKTPLLGVEIELEGVTGFDRESSRPMRHMGCTKWEEQWRAVHDGTLRNYGCEFVSQGIQSQKDLRSSLHHMMRHVHKEYDIAHSFRTSSHIHVDIRDLTPVQAMLFVLLTASQEHKLFELAGKGRELSPFCIPVGDNYVSLLHMVYKLLSFKGVRLAMDGHMDDLKYQSINVMCARRLGSVEFRHFHPIVKGSTFVSVTNILLDAYHCAKQYESSSDNNILSVTELSADIRRFIRHSPLLQWSMYAADLPARTQRPWEDE